MAASVVFYEAVLDWLMLLAAHCHGLFHEVLCAGGGWSIASGEFLQSPGALSI